MKKKIIFVSLLISMIMLASLFFLLKKENATITITSPSTSCAFQTLVIFEKTDIQKLYLPLLGSYKTVVRVQDIPYIVLLVKKSGGAALSQMTVTENDLKDMENGKTFEEIMEENFSGAAQRWEKAVKNMACFYKKDGDSLFISTGGEIDPGGGYVSADITFDIVVPPCVFVAYCRELGAHWNQQEGEESAVVESAAELAPGQWTRCKEIETSWETLPETQEIKKELERVPAASLNL